MDAVFPYDNRIGFSIFDNKAVWASHPNINDITMSLHIGARKGDIAETVLIPGDPLRAKFVAENLLENARCYNEVRGMLGFTGTYQGKRISIQGTGMGIPSTSIYVN